MDSERQSWLPALEPPEGGPERLSRRLQKGSDSLGTRRWRFAMVGTAATLAVAVVVLITMRNNEGINSEAARELYQAESFDRLLGRPIERAETSVLINDESVGVFRVDNPNPKIRIYRVN